MLTNNNFVLLSSFIHGIPDPSNVTTYNDTGFQLVQLWVQLHEKTSQVQKISNNVMPIFKCFNNIV